MSDRLLVSTKISVPHGFSLRTGGVSEGPFRSLNLAVSVGDSPEHVAENLRRLIADAGLADPPSVVSQVHGDRILEVDERATEALARQEADALVGSGERAVAVRTADCVPILLWDPDGSRVAAVHSGWRGTKLRIAEKAVRALAAKGARPSRLIAAIGPSIRPCCYEVSEALAETFAEAFGPEVIRRGSTGRAPRLDLPGAVRKTLQAAGLEPRNIDDLDRCTACEPERFFSHRRDEGRTGRHLSFIAARNRAAS